MNENLQMDSSSNTYYNDDVRLNNENYYNSSNYVKSSHENAFPVYKSNSPVAFTATSVNLKPTNPFYDPTKQQFSASTYYAPKSQPQSVSNKPQFNTITAGKQSADDLLNKMISMNINLL